MYIYIYNNNNSNNNNNNNNNIYIYMYIYSGYGADTPIFILGLHRSHPLKKSHPQKKLGPPFGILTSTEGDFRQAWWVPGTDLGLMVVSSGL